MSVSLAERLAEDRRRVILRSLSEVTGYILNETALKMALAFIGHSVSSDMVRADAVWLEQHGLVRIEKIDVSSGVLWVLRLTMAGQDVAGGVPHPGVAKRDAE